MAWHFEATVTCLRKDIIAAVNRWFLMKDSGIPTDDLRRLAAEIQFRCLVDKKTASKYCGDSNIELSFREGNEVVWVSSREDVWIRGKRESVYSGFVGKIKDVTDSEYVVEFPKCDVTVARSECTMKNSPMYLSRARNIHKLQSMGVPVVMYIVNRVVNRKTPTGWESYVDLSEAYTSVSRSRQAFIIANPYGIKVAKQVSTRGDKNYYSIHLEDAPEVDSAVVQLINEGFFSGSDE